MSLTERAMAGLVTRDAAARRDWYLTRHAARHIRRATMYAPGSVRVPPRSPS